MNAVPKKSTLEKFAYFRHFQRIGIKAKKFEKTPIHFKSDVFAAVAVADAKTPYYIEQSTANSNSFKIAQKTAFEAKGRLYTTGKVIQRLFIIDLYT